MGMEQEKKQRITRRRALGNMALGAVGVLGASRLARAQEGTAPEGGIHVETQATGSEIWQVTTEEHDHSNIYCEVPYCSKDSRYFVYFRRRRDASGGRISEFVVVEMGTWKKHVLDTADSMSGCAMTPDGVLYYVKDGEGDTLDLMRADLCEGKPAKVYELKGGRWTWSLGTVTSDHRYYLRGKRMDDQYKMYGILLVDLQKGEEKIIDQDPDTFNAHPQFEPSTGDRVMIQHNRGGKLDEKGKMIQSTGPEGATLYLLTIPDGKRIELQVGTPHTTACTGHQAWIGNTREMLLTVSAKGNYDPEKGNLLAVSEGKPARVACKGYRFCHVGVSRCGRLFSCDDGQGPVKLVIGSTKTGKSAVVCESRTQMNRSQNTHAHPYLTPDLKWVIFNSNRSGFPHIYAASVPEGMVKELIAT
ncbi:MAG: hypothetical protein AB1696_06735 [Planctomycetota bacterium]